MRFSANLSMLYPEHGFIERFGAAAADGFRGVEFVSPYEFEAQTVAAAARAADVEVVLFNAPAGDWAAGDRGVACSPGRLDEFAAGIETAIDYAEALGCPQVHVMAGIVPGDVDPAQAERVLVGNLRHAAERLARRGIRALLEPINPVDMPGYGLSSLDQAERVMTAVGHDNLWLQYDFYHMAMTGQALVDNFERLLPRISHVQIADMPGRHEPGTGSVDYAGVFAAIERSGYGGWVGAEYRPVARTSEGLVWMVR